MTIDRHPSPLIRGVLDPRRLAAVARAELHGHLRDRDLNAVVATLRVACKVPIAVINVVSHNLQTYPAEVGVGAPCTSVPDEVSFCAHVVDTGEALTVSDAHTHPVYARNPLVLDGVIGSYAGAPLIDGGFVLGSVSIFDVEARRFTVADLEILEYQARLASSVLALRRSARTDGLTGLANRGVCVDRLTRAIGRLGRHPGLAAVMYLDLDNFKHVNDSSGHDVGDWVLAELARRLTPIMRPTDTLARLGGDEFAAVFEDITTARDIDLIAARMVRAADNAWVLNGRRLPITLSIGVAVTDIPTQDAATLLRTADVAMYQAKRKPGSGWVVATMESA